VVPEPQALFGKPPPSISGSPVHSQGPVGASEHRWVGERWSLRHRLQLFCSSCSTDRVLTAQGHLSEGADEVETG
jgi:hypothetical protein